MDPSLDQMQQKRNKYRLGNNSPLRAISPQSKSQFHHDWVAVLREKAPKQRHRRPADSHYHSKGKRHRAYGRWHRILGEKCESDGAKPNQHRHSDGAIHKHGNSGGNRRNGPPRFVPMTLVIPGQIVNPTHVPSHRSWRKQIEKHSDEVVSTDFFEW